MAQCPSVQVSLTGGRCVGDTLTVHASGTGKIDQIVWYNISQPVKTATGSMVPYPTVIVAGGNDTGRAADQLNFPVQFMWTVQAFCMWQTKPTIAYSVFRRVPPRLRMV